MERKKVAISAEEAKIDELLSKLALGFGNLREKDFELANEIFGQSTKHFEIKRVFEILIDSIQFGCNQLIDLSFDQIEEQKLLQIFRSVKYSAYILFNGLSYYAEVKLDDLELFFEPIFAKFSNLCRSINRLLPFVFCFDLILRF
jgi:hypothetical protein